MVSSLLVLAVGEVAVRVWFGPEVDTAALREQAERLSIARYARASSHPELVFEPRPGADVQSQLVRVVIDDEGAGRIDPDHPAPPDPDVRVALVGDSTAFGWGVDYADCYAARLQALLTARSGHTTQVRNFAVPGYNSHHNRIVFRDRVLPWKPDLLILHWDHNDAEPVENDPERYMEPEYGDNLLHSALVKWTVRRLFVVKTRYFATRALPDPTHENEYEGYIYYAGPQYDRAMEDLAAIARRAKDAGIPALAFVFNAWLEARDDPEQDGVYTHVHRPLARRIRAMGFEVLDMYGPAQALMHAHGWKDLLPYQISRSDGHPNVKGHEWIAERLLETIAASPRLAKAAGL